MKLTRDSITLTVGAIASVSTGFVSGFNLFPWLSIGAQHAISLISFGSGLLLLFLKSSPLPVSPEGHAKEVQEHNEAVAEAVQKVRELAKAPPIPPVVPVLLLCLFLTSSMAFAQIGEEPLAWQPEYRPLAAGISDALIGIQAGGTIYQDVKTWRAGDRKPTYRSGCSIGIALALTQTLTRVFPEMRPDGSNTQSGFSSHSSALASLSGWRFEFGVPIAAMGGLLRDSANKHHLWGPGQAKDIPLGWAIGAGAQALCTAVIR